METAPTTALPFVSDNGNRWLFRPVDERLVRTLVQRYELPEIVARVIAGRGVTLETATDYLQPLLRTTLPDPLHLLDMAKAVERITEAVESNEPIAVFGDYDVDGATSSALLTRYFRMLGQKIRVYIPDRMKEGYGPNTPALLALHAEGIRLCITVDCGTASHEPLAVATEAGLEMIVIDHHLGSESLPAACAIVNPNRLDESSPCRHLAAVGVAFLLVVAITSQLRKKGFFANRSEPPLMELLDLVALGTVCDVMPLTGLNRTFVTQGLKIMAQRRNLGLRALADVAGLDGSPSVYHLGFMLGPRVNAGGRVGEAGLGSRLLATEDVDEAYQIAQTLHRHNAERQAIELQVCEEAIAVVEAATQEGVPPVLLAAGEGWHPGVIGIVAGRLKEKYHRPTAVISWDGDLGKASARSIAGVDLGSALVNAKAAGLLVAGGGHAMAAGFTVSRDQYDALFQYLCAALQADVAEHGAFRQLKIDGYLTIAGLTPALLTALDHAAPYGNGNSEPRFVIADARLLQVDVVGADHLRCLIADGKAGQSGGTIRAMAFRSLNTPLGALLMQGRGKHFHLAVKVKRNIWQGAERVEVYIDDAVRTLN